MTPNIYLIRDHFRFFLPSKSSKRVFSTNKTSPSFKFSIAVSSFSPRVSGTNITSLPNFLDKFSATGLSESPSLSLSSLTLPK